MYEFIFKDGYSSDRARVKSTQNETALINRLQDKYKEKPYYQKHSALAKVTKYLGYTCNVASIGTGFGFSYLLISKLTNVYLTFGISLMLLATIETLKRFTVPMVVKEYLQYRRITILFFGVSLALVGLSAYISIQGSQDVYKALNKPIQLVNTDSIKNVYLTNISKLQASIKAIEDGNQYKYRGKLIRSGRERIQSLTEQIVLSQESLDKEILQASKDNQEAKTNHRAETKTGKYNLGLLALLFDTLLIGCLVFTETYDFNSYLDLVNRGNGIVNETETETDNLTVPTVRTAKDTESATGTNNGNCLHCASNFPRTNPRKKFCSDKCRLQHHRAKTGKELRIEKHIST